MADTVVARFNLLGPLEVWHDGVLVDVGRRRERLVLGLLLAQAPQPIHVDRLFRFAWFGQEPPRTARNALQVCVSHLRTAVGHFAPIQATGQAYRVDVDPLTVDLHRFQALVDRARHCSGEQRIALLREATGLWRGDLLSGSMSQDMRESLYGGVEESRLVAIEEYLAARLASGGHAEVVAELTERVQAHPTRERLIELHMLALFHSGRRADALEAYRSARRHLIDELGVEPGTRVRRLHQRMLADDPQLDEGAAPASARKRFLPWDVPDFIGRTTELRWLDDFVRDRTGGAVLISAVTGTGGVGKTALAIHWAHKAADRFPDGQLYVNLRGYDLRRPLRPIEALSHLLRALDVPAERVPTDEDAAAALYRSVLAGRTMLILLDNAGSAEQVRPLLPGGSGCLVLITSRDRLAGLIARDSARLLSLDTFSVDEATELLTEILGRDRVGADPAAATDLIAICGRLPLAVRIAAANLAAFPHSGLADYVAQLTSGDRLAGLAVADDPHSAVRAVFDQSYRTLPAAARRVFRLLGLLPGPDCTAAAVAALTGLSEQDAADAMATLADAHLVVEHSSGRFTLHDLLRLYARDHAYEQKEAGVLSGLFDYYLAATRSASEIAAPSSARLPGAGVPGLFADRGAALVWFKAEQSNLVAATQQAAALDLAPYAWQLADSLRGLFWTRRDLLAWSATAEAGLRAADEQDDRMGQAAMHLNLGVLCRCVNDLPAALDHLAAARAAAQESGWAEGEAGATSSLGVAYADAGDGGRAIEYFVRALAINRAIGRPAGMAVNLGNIVVLRLNLGDLRTTVDDATQALALYAQTSNRVGEGLMFINLGIAYRQLGDLDRAREHLDHAVAMHRELDSSDAEAIALVELAETQLRLGDTKLARQQAVLAGELTVRTGDRAHQAVAYVVLARLDLIDGDLASAQENVKQALALAEEIGHRMEHSQALDVLATVARRQGDLPQALAAAEQGLELARGGGYQTLIADLLTTLAEVRHDLGDRPGAAEAAAAALEICDRTGYRHVVERASGGTAICEDRKRTRSV